MRFRLSKHALYEIRRRSIPKHVVQEILQHPQQIVAERGERKAYQSQIDFGGGKLYLVRAIVSDEIDLPLVVTVYRTRKISKYWRPT